MESVCEIGEVMIGLRLWTDLKVQAERDIVSGQDEGKAWQFVIRARQELVEKMVKTFSFVKMAEMAAYGNNSYFQKTDVPRAIPEGDLSSSSEDDSSANEDIGQEVLEARDSE